MLGETLTTVSHGQVGIHAERIQRARGGLGQLVQWRDIATALGIEIRYDSRVCQLHGNDRRVEGVRVSNPEMEYDLLGDAVAVRHVLRRECRDHFGVSRDVGRDRELLAADQVAVVVDITVEYGRAVRAGVTVDQLGVDRVRIRLRDDAHAVDAKPG